LRRARNAHDRRRRFVMGLGADVDAGRSINRSAPDPAGGLCRRVVPPRRPARGKSYRGSGAISDSHWTDLLWHRVDRRAGPLQPAARRVGRMVGWGFHSSHRGIRDQSRASATVVAVFSARMAAGEEIGWRGYMLTRLIDASVPRPVLVSGVIWGLWHVPLILGGVYLPGPPPILSALFWMVVATSASFVFARLRLETGSIWPAIALHAAWNSIIQVAFDPASTGPGAMLWVGESGIIVMLTMIAAAVVFTRGRWPVRKFPEVSRDDVAAGAAPRA